MAFTVPGYQVEQLIGYGSHAEVWSARVAATAEAVALKRIILPPGGNDPDRAVQQIAGLARAARSEAALLATLEHPSLIRFREFIQTPVAVVLAMELAEAGSLAQLLRRRGRLSPAEIAAALSPIAAALSYAHDEAVVHGDVSAANILFTTAGQPKLADLGVAHMLVGHTSPERCLGTPAYVDPVLAAGGATGAASDVFSIAAVALHCLTGSGPWQDGEPADAQAVLSRAASGVISDLDSRLAGCPEAMAAVLRRALDPEPHRRGTAAEFALDLRAGVPAAAVVLTGGRIMPATASFVGAVPPPPGVGRHSVERRDHAAGALVIPADLTHVSRPRVRPEPAPTPPPRRGRRPGRPGWFRQIGGRPGRLRVPAKLPVPGWLHLSRRPHLSGRLPLPGRLSDRSLRRSAMLVVAAAGTGVLAGLLVLAGLALALGRPAASDHRAETVGQAAAPAEPASQAAGPADPAAGVDALLRGLADRRAQAFALNRPNLLAAVYQSAALLRQDTDQLRSQVPAGCVLAGLRTSYQHVTVTASAPSRLELRVSASQSPASLVCAGTVRARTASAGPVGLRLILVKAATGYRIASERPDG